MYVSYVFLQLRFTAQMELLYLDLFASSPLFNLVLKDTYTIVFVSSSYTLCTLSCLNNKLLFSSNTSSPCFPLAMLSAIEIGPTLAQPTAANDGSLKKSLDNF